MFPLPQPASANVQARVMANLLMEDPSAPSADTEQKTEMMATLRALTERDEASNHLVTTVRSGLCFAISQFSMFMVALFPGRRHFSLAGLNSMFLSLWSRCRWSSSASGLMLPSCSGTAPSWAGLSLSLLLVVMSSRHFESSRVCAVLI